MAEARPWWTWAALGAALGVVAARWLTAGAASFTYDEATYVEWARHPWTSSYYPEDVFVRHPPLYALALAAWTAVLGEGAAVVRLLSALFTAAGILLVWDAFRARPGAAAVAALALGASPLVWHVGIMATMYPLAFGLTALAMHAHMRGDVRTQRRALVATALTHLFGVVWVAARILIAWRDRAGSWRNLAGSVVRGPRAAWQDAAWAWPVWLWFTAAMIIEFAAQDPSTGMGPAQQVIRGGLVLLGDRLALHIGVFLAGVALLVPILLRPATADARTRAWPLGLIVLLVVLAGGPPFLRYFLLLLPVVVVLGLRRLDDPTRAIGWIAAAAVIGTGYTLIEWDPGLENDRLGAVDWQEAAGVLADFGVERAVSPTITSLAYYVGGEVDSSRGPDILDVDGLVLVRAEAHQDWRPLLDDDTMAIVPDHLDDETRDALEDEGFEVCGRVTGATLWSSRYVCL